MDKVIDVEFAIVFEVGVDEFAEGLGKRVVIAECQVAEVEAIFLTGGFFEGL